MYKSKAIIFPVFLFLLMHFGSLVGQTLPGSSSIKTVTYYTSVKDSMEKLVNKSNSIVIEMCNGYSEIILTKSSKNWQGFYIKSLFRGGHPPPPVVYIKDGVTYTEKSMQTEIIKFNADSLHNQLLSLKIDSIKQIDQEQLEDRYNEGMKSEDKNIRYGLPSSSHDCGMNITLNKKDRVQVFYSNTLIGLKELQSFNTISTLNKIRSLLNQKFENY